MSQEDLVILEEIESKFRAHRKTTTHGVGKRWPEELKELLRQAYAQGFSIRRLSLTSQIHQEILKRWLIQASEGKIRIRELVVVDTKTVQPRRLESTPTINIKLPNGISMELPIHCLTTEIIHIFGSAGVRLADV